MPGKAKQVCDPTVKVWSRRAGSVASAWWWEWTPSLLPASGGQQGSILQRYQSVDQLGPSFLCYRPFNQGPTGPTDGDDSLRRKLESIPGGRD
ncbi:hypothetical protein JTB14_006016 [Gonioctena quinquepunctata]|nr:hypothetical protein JTB14_006016 [Gonioctena quinquepunctata]